MERGKGSSRNIGGNRKSTPTPKEKGQRPRKEKIPPFLKVGNISSGNVLVEMTPAAWENLCASEAETSIDLSSEIRGYRKKHKISQTEFARMVGHSRNWISILERGGDTRLSYKSLRKILSLIRE